MNKFNEPEYDKFLSGGLDNKGGLVSNWPGEHLAQQTPRNRKTLDFFAIDLDGETEMKVKRRPTPVAKALQAQYPFATITIRPVYLDEPAMRLEDEARRKRQWEEILYKPTPIRRTR